MAKPASEEEKAALVAQVLAERAAYARYKQQLVASTAALGAGLTALTFGLYSKVRTPRLAGFRLHGNL